MLVSPPALVHYIPGNMWLSGSYSILWEIHASLAWWHEGREGGRGRITVHRVFIPQSMTNSGLRFLVGVSPWNIDNPGCWLTVFYVSMSESSELLEYPILLKWSEQWYPLHSGDEVRSRDRCKLQCAYKSHMNRGPEPVMLFRTLW